MNDCIFCKIINKDIPSERVYEDASLLVINDIHPKAPVHMLVLPKTHVESIAHLDHSHHDLIGEMVLRAKEEAANKGLAERGYKLVFNVGKEGGQVIPHLHLHVLGGKQLSED